MEMARGIKRIKRIKGIGKGGFVAVVAAGAVISIIAILTYSCKTGVGTKTVLLSDLPSDEQQDVLSATEESAGEIALLTETDLNPNLIELSDQEVSIITSRAPYMHMGGGMYEKHRGEGISEQMSKIRWAHWLSLKKLLGTSKYELFPISSMKTSRTNPMSYQRSNGDENTDAQTTIDDHMFPAEQKINDVIEHDISFSDALTLYIPQEELEKLENLGRSLKEVDKKLDKYAEILVEVINRLINRQWVIGCIQRGEAQLGFCSVEEQETTKVDCEIYFKGCSTEEYSVSGTLYINLLADFANYISFTIVPNKLKFAKSENKYVEFVTGNIFSFASRDTDSGGVQIIDISRGLKQTTIEDTEENVSFSGTLTDSVTISISQDRALKLDLTRSIGSITLKLGDTEFQVNNGTMKIALDGKEDQSGVDIKSVIVTVQNLSISDSNGNQATVNLSHTRSHDKSQERKAVSREGDISVDFSSGSTSFSIEAYRFKSVSRSKVDGEKTFSLSVTRELRVDDKVIKSYSHSLTITKEISELSKLFILNGMMKIVNEKGTKIDINVKNLALEKGCARPVGGEVEADVVAGGEVMKVKASFNPGCVCSADVIVKHHDTNVQIKNADICQAKEKVKESLKGKMFGSMPDREMMDHHH